MGSAARGSCYSTAQEAGQAVCALSFPQSAVAGDIYTTYSCTGARGSGFLDVIAAPSVGASAAVVIEQTYPICDPAQQYNDLTELWLLGLAALTAIWAVKTLVYRLVAPH